MFLPSPNPFGDGESFELIYICITWLHNTVSWVVGGGPQGPTSIRINGENRGSETLYVVQYYGIIFFLQ